MLLIDCKILHSQNCMHAFLGVERILTNIVLQTIVHALKIEKVGFTSN